MFRGATLKGIIITHDHVDHKCFIDAIKTTLDQEIPTFLGEEAANSKETLQKLFSNLKFNFLEPKTRLSELSSNLNDQSLVFLVSYVGQHILFTGDATGTSFNNYLSQYDSSDFQRVEKNRTILKNTTLYIMPHHGSSSEDSWRWTNYTCKWCKDLKASFICCTPEKNSYNLPQEWIRDISWPESMRTKKKSLVLAYHLNKEDAMHEKTVSERIYITGLASFYNSETSQYLHLHINDSDDITYPDEHKSLSNMKLTNISETNGKENMSEDDDSNINMSFLKENTQKTSPQTTTLIKTRKRSLNLSREEFKSPKKDLDKKQNNQKESKIKKTLKGKDEKIEY